jgi:hypothetical protein
VPADRTPEARGDEALLGPAKGEDRMSDRATLPSDNSRASTPDSIEPRHPPSIPPLSSKSAPSPAKPVPVWYRLDDFELSHSERALLKAMFKFTHGGIMFYASLPKVARRASLSPKTVKRLIRGYVDPRNGRRNRGLLERGILTEVAEAGDGKKTATYRMNHDALVPVPRMLEAVQQELPGVIPVPKVGVAQPPVSDETPVRLGVTVTPSSPASDGGHGVLPLGGHGDPGRLGDTVSTRLGDTVSPDLRFREVEPLELKPRAKTITPGGALSDWFLIKERLQREFPEAKWIKPIYLLRVFGDALGLVMPPNGEMVARAKSCSLLQQLARAAGYSGAIIGRYPEDYELERIRVAYPDHYAALPEALRRRFESDAFPQRETLPNTGS